MSTVRKHFWHEVRRCAGGSSSPRKNGLNGCIPAVVSSTDGSYEGGTSDAEAMRRGPRSSKNARKRSLISAAFIGRSLGPPRVKPPPEMGGKPALRGEVSGRK